MAAQWPSSRSCTDGVPAAAGADKLARLGSRGGDDMKMALTALLLLAAPAFAQPVNPAGDAKAASPGEWHSLFNGRDLTGWTIKINKHPLGENYADTFRVEDGVIKENYDGYGKFDEQFGHLYSNQAYGSYVLRLE